jgi:hypothetical protein
MTSFKGLIFVVLYVDSVSVPTGAMSGSRSCRKLKRPIQPQEVGGFLEREFLLTEECCHTPSTTSTSPHLLLVPAPLCC